MKKIVLAFLLIGTQLAAQSSYNTITTAVAYLRITPDARAGAMGDGGIALSEDANSMHWNIASLSFAKKRSGISASYTPWLRSLVPDINLFYGSVYFKLDSVSAIGASFRYFSMGTLTLTSSTGTVIGQYKPHEYAVDVGYTRNFWHQFSVGVAFRYIYSDLTNGLTIAGKTTFPGEAFAGDFGLSWRSQSWRICSAKMQLNSGVALTNVGQKVKYTDSTDGEFIPINLGFAQGAQFSMGNDHRVSFQVEANKLLVPTPPLYEIDTATGLPRMVNGQYVIAAGKDPNRSVWEGMKQSFSDAPGGKTEEKHEITWSFGAEYAFKETFKVRAGYFYEHESKGNRKFVTFGAGIVFNAMQLDFSYLVPTNAQRSPMTNTLRFTLQFNFDRLKISRKSHG